MKFFKMGMKKNHFQFRQFKMLKNDLRSQKKSIVKLQSKRGVTAVHLNKIEANSLDLSLERMQREHSYSHKLLQKNFAIIQNDMEHIPDSTANISHEVFRTSKFNSLLYPIDYSYKKRSDLELPKISTTPESNILLEINNF